MTRPDDLTADLTAAALAAAIDGPPFVARLPGSAVLALTGSDARGFLHGQLANDVNGLAEGRVGRSLLLNHKGHALAETAVARTADRLLCVVDDTKLAWVKDTLERHIVFDDVKLAELPAAVVTLQGARAAEALEAAGLPTPQGDTLELLDERWGEASLVYRTRRSKAGGFDVVLLADEGAAELANAALAALAAAGAIEVGAEQLDAARVAAGVPSAGGEGGDGVLPQEACLTELLSYRKGCYLGQEIMARIEARGTLRRGLALLELEGLPTASGEGDADARKITLDGRSVGLLGTTARLPDGTVRALGVLRSDLPEDARLSVGGVAGRRLTLDAPIMPA